MMSTFIRIPTHFLAIAIAAHVIVATANADMQLTISQADGGLLFALNGSLDVSGLPGTPSSAGCGFDGFEVTQFSGGDSSWVCSNTERADSYGTPLTIFGEPVTISKSFTNDPLFVAAYLSRENTQTELIILPEGYDSGSEIDLSYFEPDPDFFGDFSSVVGRTWGASFPNGSGEVQTFTFRIVPEPSSSFMTLVVLCAGLGLFQRHRKAT